MFCLLQPFFQRFVRCLSKLKLKYVCIGVAVIALFDIFGAFTHMFEVSYNDHFIYPYNGEIQPFVDALRHNKKPEVEPINDYNYSFIHGLKDKCADPDYATLRLVFLVKSAAEHFDRRNGIRQSWGFGKRFFDVPTITIFLLGVHPNDVELQAQINAESDEYSDILQADFIDSYYNNTIKTMLGFKWAVTHCRNAKFYMFVDDDMYVSVKNVLRFIRNPAYYPDYLKEPSRRAARKREIKASDWENTNADSWSTTIEQVNKNEKPIAKMSNEVLEKSETEMLKNKGKSLSHLMKLSENSTENENNQSSPITRISKRATAKEKIMMRRKPGWTLHNKTRMPSAKISNEVLEKSEKELLKNKGKSFSHLMMLSENSTENEKNQSSLITRISKRATAKEKIMMRRRPGWSSHNKTRMPSAKMSNEVVEKSETELLKNKGKSLSHLIILSKNSTENEKNQSSPITRITKRATAKEKIMMRRRPGWTSHNKTRMPSAKMSNEVLEKSQTELLKNKPKSLSHLMILSKNSTENEKNQNSLITRISKRATAKEKIMMRRRPGWTSHNKTRMPIAKMSNEILEISERELLKNKGKSFSHLMILSENSTEKEKNQSSLITRISKREAAKEKIMMRRKPGWTLHNKTRMPSAKISNEVLEKSEKELLKNKGKSLSHLMILSENSTKNEKNQSSLITRISKRATAKEKVMMRRKPGWTSHNKSRMPIDKMSNEVLEKSEKELLKNKGLSHLMKLSENSTDSRKSLTREKRQIFDMELPDDVRLFAGYVIVSSPHRHRTSKWYVSLKEYPYHLWPPYVTAGAYILSKEGLLDMYYTSLYTQHFRFDDIFLGIVAKKADIEPFHCDEFHFYKKDYTRYNYKYVITSHGYDDPEELQQVWNEQKSLGNA